MRPTLHSILSQTYENFEVIVAGDGAGDDIRREALATGDPRVRWEGFPKAPGFGYSNRARAVRSANGSLIAYLSPDDLWAPRHLERAVRAIDRARLDFVFSKPVLVWESGTPRPHDLPFDWARGGVDPPRFLLACLSPSQVVHSKEIHDRAGGWTDALPRHGDVDLWLRCRKAGARIGFHPEPTVVRFPAYAFAGGRGGRAADLHARLAAELSAGQLVLDGLRWPLPRRVAGWGEDVARIGIARGLRWARILLLRRARP